VAGDSNVVQAMRCGLFFPPPVRTFTFADPQKWVALESIYDYSIVADSLSARIRREAAEANNGGAQWSGCSLQRELLGKATSSVDETRFRIT